MVRLGSGVPFAVSVADNAAVPSKLPLARPTVRSVSRPMVAIAGATAGPPPAAGFWRRLGGVKTSAEVVRTSWPVELGVDPPTTRTCPVGSDAASWDERGTAMLAVGVQRLLIGS